MLPVGSLLPMHIPSSKDYNTYPLIEWNASTSRLGLTLNPAVQGSVECSCGYSALYSAALRTTLAHAPPTEFPVGLYSSWPLCECVM